MFPGSYKYGHHPDMDNLDTMLNGAYNLTHQQDHAADE